MNISCFQAKSHSIDFMAATAESSSAAVYLATGCGADVRIWRGDKHCMSLLVLLLENDVKLYTYILQMIGKDKAFWAAPRNLQITVRQRLS